MTEEEIKAANEGGLQDNENTDIEASSLHDTGSETEASEAEVSEPEASDVADIDAESEAEPSEAEAEQAAATEDDAEACDYDDDEEEEESKFKAWSRKGHPLLLMVVAVAILAALSFVPWGKNTGNFLKDFNLLSDLWPQEADSTLQSTDMIDPELEAELQLKAIGGGPVAPTQGDTVAGMSGQGAGALAENPPLDTLILRDIPTKPNKANGMVLIEDYTPDGSGLKNLKRALADRAKRPARITVIGDSYIEGDVITQDLRDRFQKEYGGRGVGYVAADNVVKTFRQSVRHQNKGWSHKQVNQVSKTPYLTLAGEHYVGYNGSSINYKGTNFSERVSAWNNSRLLFIAPNDGKITLTTDKGERTFDVQKADGVQSIVWPGETTTLDVMSNVPGLMLLGVWLEDTNGVVVENMSVRGYSGIKHRHVNESLAQQMRRYVDYDLIIVEFGINALSSSQTDYTAYANMMAKVLQRIKRSYPNADILLMGIGDRGQKIHGEPHSFPTAQNMVDAQRQVAKTAGVLFWDTREAMGGQDAIVRWREEKLVNGDFIHLNHEGGRRLADLLFESLNKAIREK